MSTEIKVSNIGPIEKLVVPLPEDGGVVVLRGGQGTGKSTAIRAIESAAGSKPKDLSVRDGARRGEVDFRGAKLTVTKSRTSRTGELEVDTIEGRYDIGAIVDPGIKDPERADAARIKQVVSLTGAQPDVAGYIALVGQDVWDELDVDSETDDPVELHSRVVRALQAAARRLEKESDRASMDMPDDLVAQADRSCLSIDDARAARQKAHEVLIRARTRKEESDRANEKAETARRNMEELKRLTEGDDLGHLQVKIDQAKDRFDKATEQMESAQRRRNEWEKLLTDLTTKHSALHRRLSDIQQCEKIIDDAIPLAVPAEEINEAEKACRDADELVELAKETEANRVLLDKIKQANIRSAELAEQAEHLRSRAGIAEDVLAQSIKAGDIRVVGNRLVMSTDRSSNELFADLSHGERAIAAIALAEQYIPAGGVATISQEMWGGISDANKRAIAEEARTRGVTILTAEVNDSPLDVEVLT